MYIYICIYIPIYRLAAVETVVFNAGLAGWLAGWLARWLAR